jgi:hypothetical protein
MITSLNLELERQCAEDIVPTCVQDDVYDCTWFVRSIKLSPFCYVDISYSLLYRNVRVLLNSRIRDASSQSFQLSHAHSIPHANFNKRGNSKRSGSIDETASFHLKSFFFSTLFQTVWRRHIPRLSSR